MQRIDRDGRGNQVYLQANSGFPVFPELQALVMKTCGVAAVDDVLEPFEAQVARAG